jgi:hypothetical protein
MTTALEKANNSVLYNTVNVKSLQIGLNRHGDEPVPYDQMSVSQMSNRR